MIIGYRWLSLYHVQQTKRAKHILIRAGSHQSVRVAAPKDLTQAAQRLTARGSHGFLRPFRRRAAKREDLNLIAGASNQRMFTSHLRKKK